MFEVGFAELVVVAVVGLIVLGPERLPTVARTLGLWVRRWRATAARFRDDLEREMRAQELRALLEAEARAIRAPIKEVATSAKAAMRDVGKGIQQSVDPVPRASSATNDGLNDRRK